jgi:hypothetical protein
MESQQGALSLTLGGKAYKLYFDYTFVDILQNSGFDEALKTGSMRLLPLVTLAAIKAGDDENDIEGLTERQVSRWLSQLTAEENARIFQAYEHAMGFIGIVFSGAVKAANAVANAKDTK